MIPTEQFLKDSFRVFNSRYFSNRLKMPSFVLGTAPGYWGRFLCDGRYDTLTGKVRSFSNPRIEMTTVYSRAEKSILNTLLHEMIHYYVTSVLRKYCQFHESEFEEIANTVNRDGWDVRDTNEILSTDVYLGK